MFLIMFRDQAQGPAIIVPAAFGIILVVWIGWWPIWTLVFLAIVMLLVVSNPFSSRQGG